jgi:hypothetical protein
MTVPVRHSDSAAHRRLIALEINKNLLYVSTLTLTLSQTTTTVTDVRMGSDKTVVLTPTDANAAAENIYLSSALNGSFVLTHANAGTTRTFNYVIIG